MSGLWRITRTLELVAQVGGIASDITWVSMIASSRPDVPPTGRVTIGRFIRHVFETLSEEISDADEPRERSLKWKTSKIIGLGTQTYGSVCARRWFNWWLDSSESCLYAVVHYSTNSRSHATAEKFHYWISTAWSKKLKKSREISGICSINKVVSQIGCDLLFVSLIAHNWPLDGESGQRVWASSLRKSSAKKVNSFYING